MKIRFKKLNEKAAMPCRGSDYAAGYDLYSCEDMLIPAHETRKIGTGIAAELPENTFVGIFARSGLATKHGLRPANCTGVVDSDYRGEWIVALHNDTEHNVGISEGERIAQAILLPFVPMEFEEVEELSDTVRGDGGFGSTGAN